MATGFQRNVKRRTAGLPSGTSKGFDLRVGKSRLSMVTATDDLAVPDDDTTHPGIREGCRTPTQSQPDRFPHGPHSLMVVRQGIRE